MARVLKARYFKHQDIMEAQLGANLSYIWRSIIWSISLLKKGIMWRIGTGEIVQTFKDRWIPGVNSMHLNQSGLENANKIKTLLLDGYWNIQLVKSLFNPYIAHKILEIPLTASLQSNSRYWEFNSKGKYSVREGYKLEIGCYEAPQHCSFIHATSWWKYLWAMNIPPKVRVFWWRTLHNIIPSNANLLAHHVPVSSSCTFCSAANDSTCHALFWCFLVKPCWKKTCYWPLLKQVKHLNIIDIYLWMKGALSKSEFEGFAFYTWAIWREKLASHMVKPRVHLAYLP